MHASRKDCLSSVRKHFLGCVHSVQFAAGLHNCHPRLSIGLGLLEDIMTVERAVIAKPFALISIGVRVVESCKPRVTVDLL